MNKLYGFLVTRSRQGNSNRPVWCTSKEAREEHKKFILECVANPDYDGVTNFEDIESDVIIDKIGQWLQLESGKYLYVVKIGSVDCYGYVFKSRKLPKNIPDNCQTLWLYTNGYYLNNQNKKAKLCY